MRRCEEWGLLRWSPSTHHIWPGLIRTTQKGTKHHKSWKPPEGATSLFPVSVLLCEISCWRLRDVNVGDVSWQKLTRGWCLTISSISHLPLTQTWHQSLIPLICQHPPAAWAVRYPSPGLIIRFIWSDLMLRGGRTAWPGLVPHRAAGHDGWREAFV